MGGEEDGVVMGRAEIDMSAPFRSVKEAVMLFGERVLARQVYANKFNEMKAAEELTKGHCGARMGSLMVELEETRQKLEKELEESTAMANFLASIREELRKTNMEIVELKSRETEKEVIYSEIEDLKFVENATEVVIEAPRIEEGSDFEKRYVKFASPPALAQVINKEEQVSESQFSVDKETTPAKKKKKEKEKQSIPWICAIFSKKAYQRKAYGL